MRLLGWASLLLAGDVFLIVTHVVLALLALHMPLLSIDLDGSYAEFYQYLKWYWLVCLSLYLGLHRSEASFWLLVPVFVMMLLDDALSLHEKSGPMLAQRLNLPRVPGLAMQEAGELAFLLFASLIVVFFWALAYHFASHGRRHFALIGKLFLVLGAIGLLAGGGGRALGQWVPAAAPALGTFKHGGEMIVLSLVVGAFLAALCEDHAPRIGQAERDQPRRPHGRSKRNRGSYAEPIPPVISGDRFRPGE